MTKDQNPEHFDPAALEVKDDGSAVTTFVDGIHGLSMLDGFVVFNLTRTTVPAPSKGKAREPYVEVVERLAIPANSFGRIAHFIWNNLKLMEEHGVLEPDEGENG